MRGNKRSFPNFHFCIYDLREFKFFSPQNPGEKMTWLLPLFKCQGVLKIFEFHLENISDSETLSNSMIFTRGDKMTSSNYEIWVGSFKDQIQSPFEIIFILELVEFYSNYFSPKIKYMENRVTWFPTTENWRKINLKSFWYF